LNKERHDMNMYERLSAKDSEHSLNNEKRIKQGKLLLDMINLYIKI